MKKIISVLLVLVLVLGVAGCGKKEVEPTPPTEPAPEVEEEKPEDTQSKPEFDIKDKEIQIMDAAIYRGTIAEIETLDEKILVTLTEYAGTDYGADKIKVCVNKDTAVSSDPNEYQKGDYLEVYYGEPIEAGIDESLQAIGINNLGPADSRNLNGTIQKITANPDKEKAGSMEILNENNETIILNYDENEGTQFYLVFADLAEGDKINVFIQPQIAASMPPQVFALEVRPYAE